MLTVPWSFSCDDKARFDHEGTEIYAITEDYLWILVTEFSFCILFEFSSPLHPHNENL
jgi:hypothetical protein